MQICWQGSASTVNDVEAAERAFAAVPPLVKALDDDFEPAFHKGMDCT